jgi:hypothetical protein
MLYSRNISMYYKKQAFLVKRKKIVGRTVRVLKDWRKNWKEAINWEIWIDDRIILKQILKKLAMKVWIELIWHRTGTSYRTLWAWLWAFRLYKRRGIFWPTEGLSASQNWLCSVEFVYYICHIYFTNSMPICSSFLQLLFIPPGILASITYHNYLIMGCNVDCY